MKSSLKSLYCIQLKIWASMRFCNHGDHPCSPFQNSDNLNDSILSIVQMCAHCPHYLDLFKHVFPNPTAATKLGCRGP